MANRELSRRNLFGASALGTAALAALADPGQAAAQAVGVKKSDLPDLTIKEVKVYVANLGNVRRLNSTETGEIVSLVTNSGIEGNMTIGNRGNPPGFLAYAKGRVLGKSALDVTSITPRSEHHAFQRLWIAREQPRVWEEEEHGPPRPLPSPPLPAPAGHARPPLPPQLSPPLRAPVASARSVARRISCTIPSSTSACGTSSARP